MAECHQEPSAVPLAPLLELLSAWDDYSVILRDTSKDIAAEGDSDKARQVWRDADIHRMLHGNLRAVIERNAEGLSLPKCKLDCEFDEARLGR